MGINWIEPEVREQMNIETERHFIDCSNVYFTDKLGASLNLTKKRRRFTFLEKKR